MSGVEAVGGAGPAPASRGDEADRMRQVARELQSVFVEQLFAAMRATVPQGDGSSSSQESMFTSMMDQQLAKDVAKGMDRGLGEALYRQLARVAVETNNQTESGTSSVARRGG